MNKSPFISLSSPAPFLSAFKSAIGATFLAWRIKQVRNIESSQETLDGDVILDSYRGDALIAPTWNRCSGYLRVSGLISQAKGHMLTQH